MTYLVGVNIARGAAVIKTRANPRAGLPSQDPLEPVYSQKQISAIVKAAGKRGVLCHAYSAEGIAGAVRAGVRSIEHGVYVNADTIAEMARRHTAFTPTMATISDMAGESDPVLAKRGKTFTPVLQRAIRDAHAAGVMIVSGTDSFGTQVIPVGREATALSKAGLSQKEVLKAITVNGAKVMGWEKHVGHLRAGALADVTVLDSDPLTQADAFEHVSLVIAQGAVATDNL